MQDQKTLCRHCHEQKVNRPLGLCWRCYYAPGVRKLYPSISPFVRRSPIGDCCGYRPAPEPTAARPGTFEKLERTQCESQTR